MKTTEKPDFLGNYLLPEDIEQQKIREKYGGIDKEFYEELANSGEGLFEMYVKERENEGGLEKISGKIIDNVGEAVFNGEIHNNQIKFSKKYYEGFTNGAPEYEIIYKGTFDQTKNLFYGKYLMEGDEESWEGMFILQSTDSILKEVFQDQLN